jgi:starch synthase (maltosyl-transferring)
MIPAPGNRVLRFIGDRLSFSLQFDGATALPKGWRAFLRTNLGRASALRKAVIAAQSLQTGSFQTGAFQPESMWHDVPLEEAGSSKTGTMWHRELCLTETGYFKAKAYAVDERGWQHWPDGPDLGISVHPDAYRSANTIYCAFARMFGPTRTAPSTQAPALEAQLAQLDKQGYTVIPPSGKLRDVVKQLPHIIDKLGCRILHLLPVNPTPTTFARFGRFGSPYAVQDFTAIDPALVEFDKRTTGIDQFRELTYETHLRGARVFLDVVANHTGWGSTLWEQHPDWFIRSYGRSQESYGRSQGSYGRSQGSYGRSQGSYGRSQGSYGRSRGEFVSPGAWGVTWEDLVELDHRNPALWEELAEVFLTWCRRGVDGFRCDAGYKIPVEAWRYITARVLEEFPQTIFLLEGLGGSWQATENLLTEGGMQWAYSELFQNYSAREVAAYLDYSLRQSERVGLYVHYSETHDNERLARLGRKWSLLRNRLCGLASVSGGFGFTCGVEWLAAERLNVHESRGLAWEREENIVAELAQLNALLCDHPCFLDGATLVRLSDEESPVLALTRTSAEGMDRVLVLVNTDVNRERSFVLSAATFGELGEPKFDLVADAAPAGNAPKVERKGTGNLEFTLAPAACHCLAATERPAGLHGEAYRIARAQAAWGINALSRVIPAENIGSYYWRDLARRVELDPRMFLAAVSYLGADVLSVDLLDALENTLAAARYAPVVMWSPLDRKKLTIMPPRHWLLLEDATRFRATLELNGRAEHVESIAAQGRHFAVFGPALERGDATLRVERYSEEEKHIEAGVRVAGLTPDISDLEPLSGRAARRQLTAQGAPSVLLTNGIGGMARLRVDLGRIDSKYDCALAANLHAKVPVDRHVFAKRIRVWVVADGFISPLNEESLSAFHPGPPAHWRFAASAGDGRVVEVHVTADMIEGENTTVFRFHRPPGPPAVGAALPDSARVSLTVRVDIEDRNFHSETRRNAGTEHHFTTHAHELSNEIGFEFKPAEDRQFRAITDTGVYHHEAEWPVGIAHPVETSRGQVDHGDAYSPGWFELPLARNGSVVLTLTAEKASNARTFRAERAERNERAIARAALPVDDRFGRRLALAIQAFVVRRDAGKTVIAGYPWFLDWGRDSLICARGMLSAGLQEEVTELLQTFGKFEQDGTLPNTVHGEDASNRNTIDAPLWYGMVCEELAAVAGASIYNLRVDERGRTIADVLRNIALGYLRGTFNGIRVDSESALVWSPTHFTWMDTNHPAGTPRQGYPVEIQALWVRLLQQLARLGVERGHESWNTLAERAAESLNSLFWMEERGYPADLLIAREGQSAGAAVIDQALRSNFLFAISLGLVSGPRAQRSLVAAARHLVVPGALRSLAPLPVRPPLPVFAADGRLLNDPEEPYAGRYEGDEDTRRKPAYHNGTAWTWTLPVFCEALARAWNFDAVSVAAARAYLGTMDRLLVEGCVGHLPEVVDGDAPHLQRGCDAQAWSATEALRVWKLLATAP